MTKFDKNLFHLSLQPFSSNHLMREEHGRLQRHGTGADSFKTIYKEQLKELSK
jgi:hypothetical protein